MEKIHILIFGQVQGVGFRISTARKARQLGLTGWVKNLPEGQVEAFFEGKKQDIEEILFWCHQGPDKAQVDKIEIKTKLQTISRQFDRFEIKR